MRLLVFFIVLLMIVFLLEKIINKLLHVKTKKLSETSGKKIDRWGRGIILVISLCSLPLYFVYDTLNAIKWYWITFSTLLFGFQSILEWKYIKNSKQYVATIIFLIFTIISIYNIEYFFELFG